MTPAHPSSSTLLFLQGLVVELEFVAAAAVAVAVAAGRCLELPGVSQPDRRHGQVKVANIDGTEI